MVKRDMLYGEKRNACRGFWLGNLKERGHVKDLNVDGEIILKWILMTQCGRE